MRKPLTVIIVTLFTLKGMSRWLKRRIKAVILYIVYGIFFVDTVDTKIKARNALNPMFVETVDTLVFVTLTQHLIQSTMRWENSTLLCIKWPLTPPRGRHLMCLPPCRFSCSPVWGGSFVNFLGLVKLQGWLQARHTANPQFLKLRGHSATR